MSTETKAVRDEAEAEARAAMYDAGRIAGHGSDPDGSPDIGYSVGLGGGRMLWIGEISERLFAETGASGSDLGGSGGVWLIVYGRERGDTHVLGKAINGLDANALCCAVSAAIAATSPTAPQGADLAGLSDPIAVHANMLRGTIAKPSIANIIHLYGREALLAALVPTTSARAAPADREVIARIIDPGAEDPRHLYGGMLPGYRLYQALAKADAILALAHPGSVAPTSGEQNGWSHDMAAAPAGEEVEVGAGRMIFLAKLILNGSLTTEGESCDQWQATREGEHPPCWSDGCCWASNEDETASLQPDRWRRVAPPLERIRHVKYGGIYEVLGEAVAQVSYDNLPGASVKRRLLRDGDRLVFYRDTTDGELSCRFHDEMRDGRFEPAPPPASRTEGERPPFRTGDHILHKPTGETWVCAWADPETGYLSWLGWPPGEAKISDFELAKAATDEEHRARLRDLKRSTRRDAAKALRLYGDPDGDEVRP